MKKGMEEPSETLRFPRGVRLALPGDVPRSAWDAVERAANARIATGFVSNPCENAGYSAYLEANIHADQIWTVFEALAEALLPEVADGRTEEIFVKAAKHMQVWTNRADLAEATLVTMGVPRAESLRFIDEFPRVTERLPEGPPSS